MEEIFDVLDKDGGYTNQVATRSECHSKGLWHKAVAIFIVSEDNERILLQQRSANKKLWPNLWDITAGGHVLSGEFGYQSVIRETKEEIGVEIDKNTLEFIGVAISESVIGDINNKHFNEYYIVHKDLDISETTLQKEEVQDIKWITKNELISRIHHNYEGLTGKIGCWDYLIKYFEMTK